MTAGTPQPGASAGSRRGWAGARSKSRTAGGGERGGTAIGPGTVVAITGASRGIGADVARLAVRRGARVGLIARSADDLAAVLASAGGEAAGVAVTADVADRDAITDACARIARELGPVDVLVNNAGIGHFSLLVDTDADLVEKLWRVNVGGVIAPTQAVLPAMIDRGSGSIVTVSSVSGRIGVPFESVYSATKFAVIGLSEGLRMELSGTGVSVHVVMPGPVATDFFAARGAAYAHPRPRPVPSAAVARAVVDIAGSRRDEVYVPRWFAVAAIARLVVPPLYRMGALRDLRSIDRDAGDKVARPHAEGGGPSTHAPGGDGAGGGQ